MSKADYAHAVKQVWFCAYVHLGTDPSTAASKAGYPKNLADSAEFTAKLMEDARESGMLAATEVPAQQLLQLQVHPTILRLAYLRDNARSESVQATVCIALLDRAGVSKENAEIPKGLTEDILAREFDSWTRDERRAFMESRELPQHLRARLKVARGMAPPPGNIVMADQPDEEEGPEEEAEYLDETRVTLISEDGSPVPEVEEEEEGEEVPRSKVGMLAG